MPWSLLLIGGPALPWRSLAIQLRKRRPEWSIIRTRSIGEALLREYAADVLVIECQLFAPGPQANMGRLRQQWPEARILLLGTTSDQNRLFLEALSAGADGALEAEETELADLISAIEGVGPWLPSRLTAVLADDYRRQTQPAPPLPPPPVLTEREQTVLRLLVRLGTNQRIATEMGLSIHTIRAHLRSIMRKLGATNRVQVITKAARAGLLRRPIG